MTAISTHKLCKSAVFLTLAWAGFSGAFAQDTSAPVSSMAGCPPFPGVVAARLYGVWAVRFFNPPEGLPTTATLVLERHAEFSESLAGSVSRKLGPRQVEGQVAKAALAGDFEDGTLLLLDESSDNVNITGTWNGEMLAGSCGKQFKGVWKDTSSSAPADSADVPFTLQKLR